MLVLFFNLSVCISVVEYLCQWGSPSRCGHVPHLLYQVVHPEGLRQELGRPRIPRDLLDEDVRADEYDLLCGFAPDDLLRGLDAVHDWHPVVHYDDIGLLR